MIRISKAVAEPVTRRVEPDGEKAELRKQIVCTQRWSDRIEDWRRQQPGRIPTWSEAVRVLVEEALDARERDASPAPFRRAKPEGDPDT